MLYHPETGDITATPHRVMSSIHTATRGMTPTGTSPFSFSRHEPIGRPADQYHDKSHNTRNYYNFRHGKKSYPNPSNLPDWKTITVITYASTVNPASWKTAHFHEPLSFPVIATVAIQGVLIRQKSIIQSPINGV